MYLSTFRLLFSYFTFVQSYVIILNTLFSYASLLHLSANDFLLVIYFLF